MDRFKKALKGALKASCEKLIFEEGFPVRQEVNGAVTDFNSENLDSPSLTSYFQAFFANDLDKLNGSDPIKSVISVVGVGDMNLLGQPDKRKITVFIPPNGDALFEADWDRLHQKDSVKQSFGQILNQDMADALPNVASSDISPAASLPSSPILTAGLEVSSAIEPAPPLGTINIGGASSGAVQLGTINNEVHAPIPPQAVVAEEESPPADFNEGEVGLSGLWSLGVVSTRDDELKPNRDIEPSALESESPSPDPFAAFSLDSSEGGTGAQMDPDQTSVFSQAEIGLASFPSIENSHEPIVGGNQTQEQMAYAPDDQPNELPKASLDSLSMGEITFGPMLPGMTPPKGDFPINGPLAKMVKHGSSDLHMGIGQPIMLRIDGEIKRVEPNPLTEADMKKYLLPIMPEKNKREFFETSDTDFAYEIDGLGRFRVNIYRDINGVGAVLRIIPSKVLTADELGLGLAIRRFCTLSKGLVLVTGPTGSGKSTTLAAMIDLINSTRAEHILTIEDPVEFVHEQKLSRVTQREVHTHTESFSRALRAALREDPDIVLIGEMRDLETISIAIETAETGHLVFGTLHTTGAISTVDRIIDQFPEGEQNQIRAMLATSLKGVVSQVLLKKIGGGRVAAHEIMVSSKSIASQIRDNNIHMIKNDLQTKKADGNQLMEECLYDLIRNGVVEAKDAIMKSADPEAFIQMLRTRGINLAS